MSSTPRTAADVNGTSNDKKPIPAAGGENLELDVSKLHSLPTEQQDLFLFTYLTRLESRIQASDTTTITTQQVDYKKRLLVVIKLSSPTPTRVIRNGLGRCFDTLLIKGERKILFDTITDLGSIIGAGKNERDVPSRHAAVHCLGEIYKTAGDSAINLASGTCSSLLRLVKSAQNHAGLRAAIFRALGKVVGTVKTSLDESTARDVWKQARNIASNDKAFLVQKNAFWCLERLVTHLRHFNNVNDFETLKSTVFKAGDSIASSVRHASAACLAAALVESYSETSIEKPVSKPKKPKKGTQAQNLSSANDGEDSDSHRPGSPVVKKGSIHLEFTLPEILWQITAQYTRNSTSNRGRTALISCYASILQGLDSRVVTKGYKVVVEHLLTDLLSNPTICSHRYRLLLTRRLVYKLLADLVGQQILGEAGQIEAANILINDVLKNYPQVNRDRAEPTKHSLTASLGLLASLIRLLGSAFNPLAESCREGLLQALRHPSYTVQIHASYCLRIFSLACPQQLIQCASICMNSLNRELGFLGSEQQSPRRCVGHANGLAAIISTSTLQPLYGSLEINSRVLNLATELLKSSTNTELRVSRVQVQVAWILIGGVMALGPNFVKIHLSQLLLLWRNALPKPLTKENIGQRQSAETIYLVHVRECALGSLLSFLEFNHRLITVDVAKRISGMLKNTTDFLMILPSDRDRGGDATPRMSQSLQLPDLIQMVRRRVLQCYTQLAIRSPQSSMDVFSQSNILNFSVYCFADSEAYSSGTLSASIANSASNFESIWSTADNYAFGVSGLMNGLNVRRLPGEKPQSGSIQGRRPLDMTSEIDKSLNGPICGAREHDSVCLYTDAGSEFEDAPDPPATEVVNAAIAVFAMAFPLQDARIQESMLEQLTGSLAAKVLQKDPGRKAAIAANISLALLGSTKVAVGEMTAQSGDLSHPVVEKSLDELLRLLVINPDRYIRHAASEALGRLCNRSGNTFTTNAVNGLVETIVSNRDPNARAGCAIALGSIHTNVGGMAAGFHLRKIHGVLMSLCSDAHPTVHYWATEALSRVAESAGLTFSGYVPSTLGLLAQLWISDTHGEEGEILASSNEESELPSPVAISQSVCSLINVLGPDLQDMRQIRELLLSLVKQFDVDSSALIQAQALQCWEHFYLYAPAFVNNLDYARQLQNGLLPSNTASHEIAVDGLYSLMKRNNAQETLEAASNSFEEQIWLALAIPNLFIGIQSVIKVWLGQTCLTQTSQWITRCQEVLTKTTNNIEDSGKGSKPKENTPGAAEYQDEEAAGLGLGTTKDEDADGVVTRQELLRWQTRLLALQCLSEVVHTGGKELQADPASSAGLILQSRVADLIRMGFLASTSSVLELRIAGLNLIDQVLMIFGKTPDPDFAEALLLEQYQAQIGSALTPAFGADSSPELASAAIKVCATFIATGLVKDVDRMGRILKLMVSALTSFTDETNEPNIGELKGLSSNAQVMVRMAVLSGWAELQVASTEQDYLVGVVKPQVTKLTPLWLSSLQEFARLRFEPDISSSMGIGPGDSLDTIYAALNRQTLLKFYQDSWLKLVDAIASLIDQDSAFVFDALDGKGTGAAVNGEKAIGNGISYRDEPVAFFFVLFGIAFEALITRPGNDTHTLEDQTLDILQALKRILRPSVAGHAIYQDVIFSETMELFDRLALTEGLEIQAVIVEITRNLCLSHPSVKDDQADEEHISDSIEQLFELTRIIALILTGLLPSLADQPQPPQNRSAGPISNESTALIIASLKALVDVADVYPLVIRKDLHACLLHIFTRILGTAACQALVVPHMLPLFKRFVSNLASQTNLSGSAASDHLSACLRTLRTILSHAQRRESESSLPCARNTLFAATILLTSGSAALPPDEPLINILLDDLIDCLQDVGLGHVAANCMRSVMLFEPKSDTGKAVTAYLFPRLIHFYINHKQPDPENARDMIASTLVAHTSSLGKDQNLDPSTKRSMVCAALTYVVPALLHRTEIVGKAAFEDAAVKLLLLAGAGQGAFRVVVRRMNGGMRSFMEIVLREGGEAGRRTKAEEKEEPTIALKMEFGGR